MILYEGVSDQDWVESEAEACTLLLTILYLAVGRGEDMILRRLLVHGMILSGQEERHPDAGVVPSEAPAEAEHLAGLGLAVTSSKRAVKLQLSV
jgi:hypothetical protein